MERLHCLKKKKDHLCRTRRYRCFINKTKTSRREKLPPSGASAAETPCPKAKLISIHLPLFFVPPPPSPAPKLQGTRKESEKARGGWMGVKTRPGSQLDLPRHRVHWCPRLSPTSTHGPGTRAVPALPSKWAAARRRQPGSPQGCKLDVSTIWVQNRSMCVKRRRTNPNAGFVGRGMWWGSRTWEQTQLPSTVTAANTVTQCGCKSSKLGVNSLTQCPGN